MLELLFEIVAEIFLQIFAEALFELGFHTLAAPFRRRPEPWLAAIGYLLLGAIAGGLSLLIFPEHLVVVKEWRIANLLITPVVAGLVMSALGAWRARRGQVVLRIDRFSYGYLFAVALALVRFFFAS